MIDQAGTAVLDAPELTQQARREESGVSFDPFDLFDVEPADNTFDPCEFGTA